MRIITKDFQEYFTMIVKNQQLIEGYLEYLSANKNLSKNTFKSYKDDLVEFAIF